MTEGCDPGRYGDGAAASGWFHHRRWWIDSDGSDAESVQLASAHESNHRQLAYSTVFGNLTLVLDEVATLRGDDRLRSTVAGLIDCSRTTHEVFATWCSITALGHSDAVLATHPAYVRHWLTAQRLVEPIDSPYLRFHAVHAIARACMQAPVIDAAFGAGLDRFEIADLRDRLRPDTRLNRLSSAGLVWRPAIARLTAAAERDRKLADLIRQQHLQAALFERTHQDTWQRVNETMFDHVAAALSDLGCPTLAHDAQLTEGAGLLEEASRYTSGQPLSLTPGTTAPADRAAESVLTNFDAEGFSNGPRLRARWLPTDAPLDGLAAGLADDAHIFLTIRPGARQVDSYDLAPPAHPTSVVVRRTVIDHDDAPTVEVCDLTDHDPGTLGLDTHRVLGLVSARAQADPDVHRWRPWMTSDRAVMLLDVSLTANLDLWLATPGSRFHYCLLRTEAFGRTLPLLIARLHLPGVTDAHLMVRPLSPAGGRHHKAAFEEMDPKGTKLVADPSILEGSDLLAVVIAHLVGEETHFPAIG